MVHKYVRILNVGDRNYGFNKGQLINWYVWESVVKDMKSKGLEIPTYDKVVVRVGFV